MKRIQTIFLMTIMVGALLGGGSTAAQEGASEYFPETGHWVQGSFYEFYGDIDNAKTLFGPPITEEFSDPTGNRRVQYFRNVRLEFHAENPPGRQVVLTNLGESFLQPGEPLEVSAATPGCRQDPGWTHPVCYAFLDFFRAGGGEEVFGRPISGIESVQGRIGQYFEFAHFMWYPENKVLNKVILAPLGAMYFSTTQQDSSRREPLRNNLYTVNINKIIPRAFVSQAVVSGGGNQTVYVTVQDQNEIAVTGALVTIAIDYPDGSKETLPTTATNQDGVAEISFAVATNQVGLTTLSAYAEFGDLVEINITSFRIGN